MTSDELLARATAFSMTPHNPHDPGESVSIEFRGMNVFGYKVPGVAVGEALWCIKRSNCVLSRKGDWEYEGLPSGRTKAFIALTRYSRDEAIAMWEKYAAAHLQERGRWVPNGEVTGG